MLRKSKWRRQMKVRLLVILIAAQLCQVCGAQEMEKCYIEYQSGTVSCFLPRANVTLTCDASTKERTSICWDKANERADCKLVPVSLREPPDIFCEPPLRLVRTENPVFNQINSVESLYRKITIESLPNQSIGKTGSTIPPSGVASEFFNQSTHDFPSGGDPARVQSRRAPNNLPNSDANSRFTTYSGGNLQSSLTIGSSTFYNYSDSTLARMQGMPNSAIQIGKSTFFDNGQSAIAIGNSTFYSNGQTKQKIGYTDFYSNGRYCQAIGSVRFCN